MGIFNPFLKATSLICKAQLSFAAHQKYIICFFSHCDGWLREFGLCFPSYLLFTAILTSIAKPLPTGTFVVSHGINGHTVYLIRHIDISMLWVCVFKYVCLVGLACCYGWMEVFIFSAVIWPLILSVCVCLCVCVFDCLASWPFSRITSLAARSSAAAACEPATRLQTSIFTPPCVPWTLCLLHLI